MDDPHAKVLDEIALSVVDDFKQWNKFTKTTLGQPILAGCQSKNVDITGLGQPRQPRQPFLESIYIQKTLLVS